MIEEVDLVSINDKIEGKIEAEKMLLEIEEIEEEVKMEDIEESKESQVKVEEMKAIEEVKVDEQVAVEEIERCDKVKKCGHRCNGVEKEARCLPCLDPECADPAKVRNTSDELCAICYTSELGEQSCVKLECGHVFHADCILQLLKHKWSTLKVSFAFLCCPSCKAEITVFGVNSRRIKIMIAELQSMKDDVEKKALEVAKNQGLDKSERVQEGGDYHGKLLEFALHSCAFYQCFDCEKIYFGGMIDCQAALGQEEKATKEDLIC